MTDDGIQRTAAPDGGDQMTDDAGADCLKTFEKDGGTGTTSFPYPHRSPVMYT
jgi:hypothetical protein